MESAAADTLADTAHRLLDTVGPRIAVTGKHEIRGDPLEAGQGRHGLGGIRREWRHPWAASARCDGVRRKGIADEERTEGHDVKRGAARRVAGSQDDPRTPWHVQSRSVAEGGDL